MLYAHFASKEYNNMKKTVSFLIVLCMLISASALFAVNTEATYGFLLGDADDSLQINMKDILLTRRYAAGLVTEKDIDLTAADADESGSVNLRDVLLIRKHVAGTQYLEGVNEDGKYKVGTLSVAGRNISRFQIVISSDATECMKNAANVLSKYIANACGYTLSVTNADSQTNAYKINFAFDNDNLYELGSEGYRVYVDENGNLNVVCGTLRGPLYATYFILEELVGYRFFTFKTIEEYLFESESINIDESYDETEIPALRYRKISYGSYNNKESFHATRLNDAGSSSPQTGYCEGYVFTYGHSYYYQMAGFGCQDNALLDALARTQPCLSSQDTFEKIIKYNNDLIAFRRDSWGQLPCVTYTELPCTPNDNTNFCQCNECKRIYGIEGSIAGTVFRMSNRVIEYHQKDYPDIKLHTLAYWDARNPPKVTRPDEAINVMFCVTGCNNHFYGDTTECDTYGGNPRYASISGNGQSNSEEASYIKGWAELTDNIYLYYYGISFHTLVSPCPNVMNFLYDYQYLASIGVKGSYCEGADGYTFEKLKFYLEAKVMWDPYMTVEEYNRHINEFLEAYYGDGWEYIREYLDMQTEAGDLQSCFTNNFDRPWNMYNKEYFADNYHYMLSLMDKAEAAANTEEQAKRVRECRIHIDYLGLSATYERDYVNADSETKAAYAKRYSEFYDFVKNNEIELWSAGCTNFPSSRNDIVDTMSWYFKGYTGIWVYNDAEGRWT